MEDMDPLYKIHVRLDVASCRIQSFDYRLLKCWCKVPRGRPRQTWLRTVENDLKHQNLGLWSARHRAYDRDLWREIVEINGDAPAGTCYMMMMMIMEYFRARVSLALYCIIN